jgi:cytochrome P450
MQTPGVRRAVRAALDLRIDPYDPAFRADPYPTYRRLRERAPVHRTRLGVWLLSRHADGLAVLGDPRFVHPDYRAAAARRGATGALAWLQGNMLISMNPPDHTRLRRVVADAFTGGCGADLRARIHAVTEELIDRIAGAGRMDAVRDLAVPLPIAVVAEILGIPRADAERCRRWTREVAATVEPAPTGAERARAEAAAGQLVDYFRRVAEARRTRPGHDAISALVRARQEDGALDDGELVASAVLLFAAGHETTVAFLGTALLALLRNPSAWEALHDDPTLGRSGIDELFRYDPPVQLFGRQAREDVVLDGRRIRRGETVFLLVGAMNRDPERFPDPDRLDLRRRDSQHLAFGHGLHACLGQALARLEGQVVLETLARRLPGLRLRPEPPVWRPSYAIRALDSLAVAW